MSLDSAGGFSHTYIAVHKEDEEKIREFSKANWILSYREKIQECELDSYINERGKFLFNIFPPKASLWSTPVSQLIIYLVTLKRWLGHRGAFASPYTPSHGLFLFNIAISDEVLAALQDFEERNGLLSPEKLKTILMEYANK